MLVQCPFHKREDQENCQWPVKVKILYVTIENITKEITYDVREMPLLVPRIFEHNMVHAHGSFTIPSDERTLTAYVCFMYNFGNFYNRAMCYQDHAER